MGELQSFPAFFVKKRKPFYELCYNLSKKNDVMEWKGGSFVELSETVALLSDKKHSVAYEALQKLQEASEQGPEVAVFVPHFYELLDSKRSYVRTRGIILLAANAKWISEKELERILPKLLEHIADPKPITARQCIQCLPQIVDEKPVTAPAIVAALKQVKLTGYQESMQKLLAQDIQQVLRQIQKN